MSALAPTLEAFFTERLMRQRQASRHTIAAYRDTFRLLLTFAQARTDTAPSRLEFDDLDAPLIGAFLDHLEHARGNSPQTRNARLAAIHSLFRFATLRHPEHAALIARVLAIPPKRFDRADVSFLDRRETEALLAAPDRSHWMGRRDHALLTIAVQTGLRVSELSGLCCGDIQLGTGANARCYGKGRRQRCTPLTPTTAKVLRAWTHERSGQPGDPLFPTGKGGALSRDAIALLVAKHAATAAKNCPSLPAKAVSPHTLRHTCAMNLLHEGVDVATIALLLGHANLRSVESYIHADNTLKERALARTRPPGTRPGRYRPPDRMIQFLESL
ncbi:MAG: tyrosine-type recombinase/integrase [Mycobacteriales bacterium]